MKRIIFALVSWKKIKECWVSCETFVKSWPGAPGGQGPGEAPERAKQRAKQRKAGASQGAKAEAEEEGRREEGGGGGRRRRTGAGAMAALAIGSKLHTFFGCRSALGLPPG